MAASNRSPKTPRVKFEPGPLATLGSSAAAGVRFIVWCKACGHQIEPDPTEKSERYGAETTLIDWHARLMHKPSGTNSEPEINSSLP
jgi:hypothetical protein